MAKILRYCSSTKDEYTSGRRLSVERNSRMFGAIDTVADILDRLSRTPGSSLYIVSFISKAEIVRATTQVLAVSEIFNFSTITYWILSLNLKVKLVQH